MNLQVYQFNRLAYFVDLFPLGETISAQEVLAIIGGVAGGLEYMHRNRCIHRDIKPANVLLTTSKEVSRCAHQAGVNNKEYKAIH